MTNHSLKDDNEFDANHRVIDLHACRMSNEWGNAYMHFRIDDALEIVSTLNNKWCSHDISVTRRLKKVLDTRNCIVPKIWYCTSYLKLDLGARFPLSILLQNTHPLYGGNNLFPVESIELIVFKIKRTQYSL